MWSAGAQGGTASASALLQDTVVHAGMPMPIGPPAGKGATTQQSYTPPPITAVTPAGTPRVSYVPRPEPLGIQSSPQNIVDTSSRRFLTMNSTGTPHAGAPHAAMTAVTPAGTPKVSYVPRPEPLGIQSTPQSIIDTSSRRFLPMNSTGTPLAATPHAAMKAVTPAGTPRVSYVPRPETLGIQSSPQNIVDNSSGRFLPMNSTGTPHAAFPRAAMTAVTPAGRREVHTCLDLKHLEFNHRHKIYLTFLPGEFYQRTAHALHIANNQLT
jgi:hypothetical protein